MADLAETNRKHFDKVASTHQTDFGELIAAAIRQLQARRHWISSKWVDNTPDTEIRLLDYACGAGTVSKALAPYVTEAIGLDVSANMVTEYNDAAQELGLSPARMRGHQHDLLSPSEPSPDLPSDALSRKFDIIVIGMALHHVADPGKLLRRFAELLKTGGACVVLDMVPGRDDSGIHESLHGLVGEQLDVVKTIGKHGFTEDETRGLYEAAGMGKGFEYVVLEEKFRFRMFGKEFGVQGFIARGEAV
ncbi:S-adenosyl-L-methionine-dependent methyltransferase [Aspergillus aurantiobrunneus]